MTVSFAPFDAVVFDLDGTLLDTELVFREIVFSVTQELGFTMTDDVHMRMVGSSHEATSKLLVEAYGVSFPYAMFDEKCRFGMKTRMAISAVPLKPGAIELIDELRSRGIPAAIATSSRRPHVETHLGATGLLEHFQTIVTRDDVTYPKPHPEPYLMAAERLQVDPRRCIAFEDSHTGVRAAHAAGMQTVMVPDLVHPTDEIEALCVAVLESLAHVPGHVWPKG